jgi:4-amino-4-deoxy-L-arabinose transferase-like glycosyltransferase
VSQTTLKAHRFQIWDWKIPVLLALVEGLTHFGVLQGDSEGYTNMVELFRGTATLQQAQVLHWHGILRPIVPLLAVPFSFLVTDRSAVAIVNVAFVLLGTYMVYQLGKRLFGKEEAFITALVFASSVPILAYGTAVLTDGAGYAMLGTLIFIVLFVLPEKQDVRTAIITGLLIGLGILTKETNFIVVLLLWVNFLINRNKLKASSTIIITAIALLISFSWAQYVGHSYLQFYGEGLEYNTPGYKGPLLHLNIFVLSWQYAYSFILLPFAFLGFFYVEDEKFKTLLEILFSTGILVLLWPTLPEGRFTFLTFPAIIPFAAFAISRASTILAERPFFKRLISNRVLWIGLILAAVILYNNLSGLKLFRLP